MSLTLAERPVASADEPRRSGVARHAVVRWSWRLFRREWRQQLLVLALVVVAVAATVVAAAVATNSPAPAGAGFGTAQDRATLPGATSRTAEQVAALEHRFGRVDVIEDQTLPLPGSTATFELRAQDPHGPYGSPMLALVSGRWPAGRAEVAMTSSLASDLGLGVGQFWHVGGTSRRVVGVVENPQSLLDDFALVAPGQVAAPTAVTVLFDGHGSPPAGLAQDIESRAVSVNNNAFNPETISLAGVTIGMLLIALVAVGGFTVLAQRRLRSLGMLASLGATERQVSLVVRANGLVVGVVGALGGALLGLLLWLAYRPHLEASSHHRIGMFALPWLVVALSMVLAALATYFAARRPARAITRIPVVAALSGRPPEPKRVRRSAVPGIVVLGAAFVVLGYGGSQSHAGGGAGPTVIGLVLLIPGVILLAPFFLTLAAQVGKHTPVTVRLALRDLARFRARAGSALAAISVGVLIAVIIVVVAATRYGDVLDYAGPNLASNQLVAWAPNCQGGCGGPGVSTPFSSGHLRSLTNTADAIGASLGAEHVVELDSLNGNLDHSGGGRQFSGQLYVLTPQLMRSLGIRPSQIEANADIVTSRPGFSGISHLHLDWCAGQFVTAGKGQPVPGGGTVFGGSCTASRTLAHPVVQELAALPTGTSGPNIVVTEHAMRTLALTAAPAGWLITAAQPISALQIRSATQTAAAGGMSVESKNDQPTSAEVVNWATVFGITLALAILAMSVGLIRSETAGDLRTLTATGASSFSRRAVTAATAGSLGFLGAFIGTATGYLGVIGWLRSNSLEGGISALGHVPVKNLLVVLVGMPLLATVVGWLVAGREPRSMVHQPIE
ncbi:MAG TPA: FtsX-like permease family protein [Acidimicrobiales bacterium]|nr:FtsX-like permease family protein [Acidimicrobiales bacterium]